MKEIKTLEKDIGGLHILCLYPSPCPEGIPAAYILEPVKNMGALGKFVPEGDGCVLVSIFGMDWDRDLTPWPAPRAYRRGNDFEGGADGFRKHLVGNVIPLIEESLSSLGVKVRKEERFLVGISLAGLFSLQTGLVTTFFKGVGSISGSLWYDGFTQYVEDLDINGNDADHRGSGLTRIYLSLGEGEKDAKSPRLASVQRNTEAVLGILRRKYPPGVEILFEMNPGNHFSDPIGRISKALRFLLGIRQPEPLDGHTTTISQMIPTGSTPVAMKENNDNDLPLKRQTYRRLQPIIASLTETEKGNRHAVLQGTADIIHAAFPLLWTGFYIVTPCPPTAKDGMRGEELRLGPNQGPPACERIRFGKGVCGTAWKEKRSLVVPDVEEFPGHIACSSLSRSEIVVPVFFLSPEGEKGEVAAVLDIDSEQYGYFDETDRVCLEEISAMVSRALFTTAG